MLESKTIVKDKEVILVKLMLINMKNIIKQ